MQTNQRMKDISEMESLIKELNQASDAYYNQDKELISNFEYDQLYDRLAALEERYGIILAGSPTQNVGFPVVSELKKERHSRPALSLDKTKDRSFIGPWLGERDGVMSWKLDGLTIVATYDDGRLIKAVTRGNGEIGEDVTHNARYFHGLPQQIPFPIHMVVRGEAFISYSEFERINREIPETEARYKNPRNLASGTVRQYDSKVAAQRNVQFQAFELVELSDKDANALRVKDLNPNLYTDRFRFLEDMGFGVVEHVRVTKENAEEVIPWFEAKIEKNDFPSDGLVLMYNDIAYGQSLGTTGKFPRWGIAFKWEDEMAETVIRRIEWNASRTGLINPVAVFDSVELEGTTVSRATAHNVSILKKLKLAPGSRIHVYKANMIIPTIYDNMEPAGEVIIPEHCPVCGAATELRISEDRIETLYCPNPECPAKQLKAFAHFVSRNAMNIENLSEGTLQKLIDAGLLHNFQELYSLHSHESEIALLEGMGETSARQLNEAIEQSRATTLERFLYALGIPLIGRSASKELSKRFNGRYTEFHNFVVESMQKDSFSICGSLNLSGFGEKMAESMINYFCTNLTSVEQLAAEMIFQEGSLENENALDGKIFVITGSVEHFKNREELKNKIEHLGGKVSGSVSAKTNFLINNDTMSGSSKNKKAKELGISIISEEDFLKMIEPGLEV